jgi:hypothetical protein
MSQPIGPFDSSAWAELHQLVSRELFSSFASEYPDPEAPEARLALFCKVFWCARCLIEKETRLPEIGVTFAELLQLKENAEQPEPAEDPCHPADDVEDSGAPRRRRRHGVDHFVPAPMEMSILRLHLYSHPHLTAEQEAAVFDVPVAWVTSTVRNAHLHPMAATAIRGHREGWRLSRIARETGMARSSVVDLLRTYTDSRPVTNSRAETAARQARVRQHRALGATLKEIAVAEAVPLATVKNDLRDRRVTAPLVAERERKRYSAELRKKAAAAQADEQGAEEQDVG